MKKRAFAILTALVLTVSVGCVIGLISFNKTKNDSDRVLNLDTISVSQKSTFTAEDFNMLVEDTVQMYNQYEEIHFGETVIKSNCGANVNKVDQLLYQDYNTYLNDIYIIIMYRLKNTVAPNLYTTEEEAYKLKFGEDKEYSKNAVVECGFIVCDLKNSGFDSAVEMMKSILYSNSQEQANYIMFELHYPSAALIYYDNGERNVTKLFPTAEQNSILQSLRADTE